MTKPMPIPMSEPATASLWGYIAAAIGAVMFALKAIFIKLAYQPGGGLEGNELDSITLLALRMVFSVPVYIIIGWVLLRRKRANGTFHLGRSVILKSIGVGFISYYLCSILDFEGLKYITAQLERILLFTYPAFVVILGALFFGAPVTKRALACILLAYSGVIIIYMGGDIATGENVVLGSILLIACAVLFALYQLLAKGLIAKMGSAQFTCVAMIAAGVFVFTHFITQQSLNGGVIAALNVPPRIYVLAIAIAICSTLIPSFLTNVALGRISAQAVATIGMVSPVTTVIIAVIVLDEPFGWIDAFGTALTILGIGFYTLFDKRERAGKSSI